jgi:intracellular septation protein
MRNLLEAGKLLLIDLAATLFFLVLYLLTHNVALSVILGMALGIAQIGWQLVRRMPIDTMQWLSLFLVLAAGTVTLITDDPRFVMIKPSVIYFIVGVVMLKRGWINRYLPPIAIELVPDIAVILGYAWSGVMFFSAALNLIVALNFSVLTWSVTMSIYGIGSKVVMFLIGYAVMRTIGRARHRRRQLQDATRELADATTVDSTDGAGPASIHSAITDDLAKAGNAS